jgi:purine-binding chemotaxis protein CheW
MQDAATAGQEPRARQLAGKYLTFTLASEEYGLPVLRVREIIGMLDITAVPQVPSYVKGVINLRGQVVPVADLRTRFGLEPAPYTERTSIVVTDVHRAGQVLRLGVVVDAVSEVLNIGPSEVEPTPRFGEGVRTDYLMGMAKSRGRVTMLLDLDPIFGDGMGEGGGAA